MNTFGLNNVIRFHNETYNFETSYNENTKMIISKVLKEGEVVFLRRFRVAKDADETSILEYIKEIHTIQMKEIREWLGISKEALKKAPSEMHVKLGEKFMKMGLYHKAETHFKKALEGDTSYFPAYINLAKLFYIKNELDKSHKVTVRALEKAPDRVESYILMAKVLYKGGKEEQSERFIQEALKRNPSNGESHYILSKILLKKFIKGTFKDREKIIAEIKGLPLMDQKIKTKEYEEAVKLLDDGKYQSALEKLEEMEYIYIEPVHTRTADILLLRKFGEDSKIPLTISEYILKLQELLENSQNDPTLHSEIARMYILRVKEYLEQARFHLKKSLAIDSENKEVAKRLGLLENELQGYILFLKATER